MRRDHPVFEGNTYFLTLTVEGWIDVFSRPRYRHIIVDALIYCQQEKGLIVYGWCLMSNHLHMIAGAEEGYHLSDTLRDFKKFTAKNIVAAILETGESRREWMIASFSVAAEKSAKHKNYKFWKAGNAPKVIYSLSFFKQKLTYIHQNPVKAQIVTETHHYVYSSAANYSGMSGLIPVEVVLV